MPVRHNHDAFIGATCREMIRGTARTASLPWMTAETRSARIQSERQVLQFAQQTRGAQRRQWQLAESASLLINSSHNVFILSLH
jgi:hypothetical protein